MRAKSVVSGVVVFGLLLAGSYLLVRYLDQRPIFPLGSRCQVSGDPVTVRLRAEQMANAATIAAVGLRRGLPERAVTVALATALQESELRNLPGGDRDSVGLFQQRPSQGWGDPSQLSDPRYAAGAFYDALVEVPGWETMRITDAAQAVQRSAHPEAYQKWADEAEVLTAALAGNAPGSLTCRLSVGPAQPGQARAQALEEAIARDWGDTVGPLSADNDGGVRVPVSDDRSGWRVAHWLVSHAAQYGITDVTFAGKQWTASEGEWRTVSGAATEVRAILDTPAHGD